MSRIIFNKQLSKEFYLMKVEHSNNAQMGQFYMLRSWDKYPVLSRPISVFDTDGETVSFLYKVMGKGTESFSALKAGEDITLQGPNGNTFPHVDGKIAMVGGGVGIAPFYLAAKRIKKEKPDIKIDLFLGFREEPILIDDYTQIVDRVIVNVGGFITDEVDPMKYDFILACGPEIMMRTLYKKHVDSKSDALLYVSMENRMACGIGACLGCSCKTRDGNKKVCKDGPIFLGEAVFSV